MGVPPRGRGGPAQRRWPAGARRRPPWPRTPPSSWAAVQGGRRAETSRTYLYFLVALVLLELLLGYELLVAHAVGQLHLPEALWFRWLPSVP